MWSVTFILRLQFGRWCLECYSSLEKALCFWRMYCSGRLLHTPFEYKILIFHHAQQPQRVLRFVIRKLFHFEAEKFSSIYLHISISFPPFRIRRRNSNKHTLHTFPLFENVSHKTIFLRYSFDLFGRKIFTELLPLLLRGDGELPILCYRW